MKQYSKRIYLITGLLMLCSEIWKQYTLTFLVHNGTYIVWNFPFQLCSVPMYLCLLIGLLPDTSDRMQKVHLAMKHFLMTFGLMGGILAFCDTSGMHYSYELLTIHSYVWHLLLIALGIFSARNTFHQKYTLRMHLPVILIYLICCVIATAFNFTLEQYGEINMFYINFHHKMCQVVFCDIATVIGNTPATFLYILCSITGSLLFCLFWNILFASYRSHRSS